MKAKSILLLIFGIFFAGAFTLIIGSAVFTLFILPQLGANRAIELNKKRSAETTGTFSSVSKHSRRLDKTGCGGTSYTYNYKYVVNDVPYNAEQSTGGSENKSGDTVKVCYDPADPKSSEFYSLKVAKTCGN